MEVQRTRSRGAISKDDDRGAEFAKAADFRSEFVGFEKTDVLTQIGALEEVGDGLFLAKLRETPFYAAGGGQVTDQGWLEKEDGTRAELREAYRFDDDQVLLFAGEGFAAGDRVKATVSWSDRFPTMANHTATHLLQKALQDVLGEHVHQAGSAVRPDKLRFDFTHPQQLTAEERHEVERRVNHEIAAAKPVRIFEAPIAEARELGAMMLFGEKYGDVVRVVEVPDYSRELCGGTHVRSTAEIGGFAITSESSVGSGARRIEAVTAADAFTLLKGRADEVEELRAELERVKREAKQRKTEAPADDALAPLLAAAKEAAGFNVVTATLAGLDADALLELSDRVKQKAAPAAVVLGSVEDGRVHLIANFDKSLEGRVEATAVIRGAAALVGGGGGGRAGMARAGGKDPDRLQDAIDTAERLILDGLA